MKVREIVTATQGKLISGDLEHSVCGFTQDTRNLQTGDMYIPLVGEHADGHKYIDVAFEKGASTVVTMYPLDYPEKNVILVKDTFQALQDMAYYISHHNPMTIVGITGSVGKTSTKDMISSVVAMKYKTLKTLGNYNNHLGLPLTVLRYRDEDAMILEMGMNHLGEIHYLSQLVSPTIAVITNIGTAHIGELGSKENILKAKLEIVDGLQDGGVLILNDDDEMLHAIPHNTHYHIVRVGHDCHADLRVEASELGEEDSYFDLIYQQQQYHVHVPLPGEHFIQNALLAIAVGLQMDIDIEMCIQGVENFQLTKGRMDIIELKNNIKVIDGSYNANFDSMKSSLDVLGAYPRRKIAILADMLELGEHEQAMHENVGLYVASQHIDILLCVGSAAQSIVASAKTAGMKDVYHFKNNQELIGYMNEIKKSGDVLLVKGSHGMHLEEIINDLKEDAL